MIKNNLKKLRGDKPQSEISNMLGISQGVYSMIEGGRAILDYDELEKLVVYYGVPSERIYPSDIMRSCFGIGGEAKERKPKTATVKLPIALAEQIDKLITEGLYLSRTDFVAAATREKLGGDNNGQDAQEGRVVPIQLPEGQGA